MEVQGFTFFEGATMNNSIMTITIYAEDEDQARTYLKNQVKRIKDWTLYEDDLEEEY